MAAISGVSGHHPLNRHSKRANQQEKQMKKRVENVGDCNRKQSTGNDVTDHSMFRLAYLDPAAG